MSVSDISIEQIDDIAVISPNGDLESFLALQLGQLLGSLLSAEACKVVINLASVKHIHFALIKEIMEVAHIFQDFHGDLRFAEANSYVKKIFQAMAEGDGQDIFDSLGDAVLSFNESQADHRVIH